MDIWIPLTILSIISNTIIAIYYVFSKKALQASKFHLSISFMALSLWGVTQIFNYHSLDVHTTLLSVRIAYGFVGILIYHIYSFISTYSGNTDNLKKTRSYIYDLLIIAISISPLLVARIDYLNGVVIATNNDIPLLLYMTVLIAIVILILIKLFKVIFYKGNEIIRFSLIIFSVSILTTVCFGIIFNYLLPNFSSFQEKSAPLVGYNSTIIFSFTTAYIFSRTQYFSLKTYLLKISLILIKTIYFLLIFLFVSYLQIEMWGSVFDLKAIFFGIIVSIIMVYITDLLYGFANKIYGYKESYITTGLKLFEGILEANNYQDLYIKLKTLTEEKGIPARISLLTTNPESYFGDDISTESIKLLKTSNIEKLINVTENKIRDKKNKQLYDTLEQSGIEIVKRIVIDNNSDIYILFTKKLNNQLYTITDINFVIDLEQIIKISVANISYLKDRENFNLILQQKVDTQTKALQEAYDRLKKEDEGKNDILNIVSHQLLTPISIIRGEIEELREVIEDEKKERPIIDTLAFHSKRSYEIVDEILRVSRVIQSGGAMTINKTPVNIVEMLESLIKTFEAKAKFKKLKLGLKIPAKTKDIVIDVDKEKITEAVSNLIDNAINYTQEGGVTVEVEDYHQSVDIIIRDTGIGIKKDNIKELFNKFIRLDNAKQIRPDGTGIGLYFVKLVIDAHDGKVSVKSEGEGKGSTFTIKLLKKL